MSVSLERIAATLRQEGGLLATFLDDAAAAQDPGRLGALAAAGPRSAGREEDIAYVVEAVHEGWRLHARRGDAPPRVVRTDDPDLDLLAGDRLYALGLARLTDLGDMDSVAILTDVIALAAQASAEDSPQLAIDAWEAGATGVGLGDRGAVVGLRT